MYQVPVLRIISDKLWQEAQKRRTASLERFSPHRNTDGTLNGRPEAGLISAHLLNGFAVCGECGGSLSYTSKNGNTHAYYCTRRRSYGKLSCSNYRGVPEAALNAAVLDALHKLTEDPDVLWAIISERAERWRRDRALQSDERANSQAEEQRLEQAIGRLLDHMEAGEDVEKRLKQRRAQLDALRVRLAEPEGFDLDEARFEKELAKTAEWLKWHGPLVGSYIKEPNLGDIAQTRSAMRALGIQKIVVTPTADGWTFSGDGNLGRDGQWQQGISWGPPSPPRSDTPRRSRGAPRVCVSRRRG